MENTALKMKAFASGDIRPISLELSCLGILQQRSFPSPHMQALGNISVSNCSWGSESRQGTVGFWDSHRGLILEEGPVRLRHLLSMGLDGLTIF